MAVHGYLNSVSADSGGHLTEDILIAPDKVIHISEVVELRARKTMQILEPSAEGVYCVAQAIVDSGDFREGHGGCSFSVLIINSNPGTN